MRDVIRRLHDSIRTRQAYGDWIPTLHPLPREAAPRGDRAAEVEAFLTHLAVQGKAASSTQNQALNAIVFLYRQVLKRGIGGLEHGMGFGVEYKLL